MRLVNSTPFALAACALLAAACGDTTKNAGSSDGRSGSGGSSGSGATGGSTGATLGSGGSSGSGATANTTPPPRPPECGDAPRCEQPPESCPSGDGANDLYACEQELACPAVCTHLYTGDCSGSDALSCGAALAASNDPGLLLMQGRSGPGGTEGDWLVTLLGDGRAIRQMRGRSCPPEDWQCDLSALDWTVGPQELCDAVVDDTCDAGDEACSFPLIRDCIPLEAPLDCGALGSLLSGGGVPSLAPDLECQEPAFRSDECETSLQVSLLAEFWPAADDYELRVAHGDATVTCSFELAATGTTGVAGAAGGAGDAEAGYAKQQRCTAEGGDFPNGIPAITLSDTLVVHLSGAPNDVRVSLTRGDDELFDQQIAIAEGCTGARVEYELTTD